MLINIIIVLWTTYLIIYRTLSISICTNTPVQKCPTTREAWASKNARYRCTGVETYVCIRDSNGNLTEGCMTNFTVDSYSGNCPVLFDCINNRPYLGTHSSFFPCPERIPGCPAKNHTDYTLQELYKYPRCIESNFSVAHWSTSLTTATTQLATTSSNRIKIHGQGHKHIAVSVAVSFGIFFICIGSFIIYTRYRSSHSGQDEGLGTRYSCYHCDQAEGLVADSLCIHMNDEDTVKIELESDLGIDLRELRTLIININDSEASKVQILPLKTDDTIDLNCIYVPVLMTDETEKRNSDWSSNEEFYNVTPSTMFYVQHGQPARYVFMLGEAGYGKTVQCQRITNLWCQLWQNEKTLTEDTYSDPDLARVLKNFDFLFFVQCRNVNEEALSLIEMIQDVYSRYHLSKKNLYDIRRILEGNEYKSLVLLDGLDEWNIPQDKRESLLDKGLPNCRDMPKSTILISMRSWKFMEIEQICRSKVDKVIRLNGFQEDGIKELSGKMLSNYFKKDKNILQDSHLSDSYHLKPLMRIPLLAVFCFLSLYEDVNTGYSCTTFYLSMMEALLKRNVAKLHTERSISKMLNTYSVNTCVFGKYPYVGKLMPELSCLGKIAFENLTSQDKPLVLRKEHLNEQIEKDTLDLCLKIGLVMKKQTSGRFYEDNIRILFIHKTIQEFLSALYLFQQRDGKPILECLRDNVRNIPKALELSSTLIFLCGLSPSVGCEISNLITDLADKDEDINTYRINFQYRSYQKVFFLYNLQLRCYREVRGTRSIETFVREENPFKFTFTDVILLGTDSDKITIGESVSVLQFHANDIRSLNMICIPDTNDDGITNSVIKTFLDESRSIESLYIDGYVGGKCRLFTDSIRISNIRTLGLANIAFRNENLTEMLLTDDSMKRLRSLALLHLKSPKDLDAGFLYQLPSIHWLSINKSGFIRKACSLPPDLDRGEKEEIPLLTRVLENLSMYKNLTTFYITYMDACNDRQMLLEMLPELHNLDALCHIGYYGSLIHHNPNAEYDAKVISCIVGTQNLRYLILRQISLSENSMSFEKLLSLEVIWLAMFQMKSSDWKDFMMSISSHKTLGRIGLIDTNMEEELFEECKIYLGKLCVEKFETSNW